MHRGAGCAALLAATAALAGCGAGASERDVEGVVARFQEALAARDGAVACAQLTPATRAAVAQDEGAPCARALLGLDLDASGPVRGARVYMTNAFAHMGGQAAFLDQTPTGWRIGAAGCTPTRADLPYDCEVER